MIKTVRTEIQQDGTKLLLLEEHPKHPYICIQQWDMLRDDPGTMVTISLPDWAYKDIYEFLRPFFD